MYWREISHTYHIVGRYVLILLLMDYVLEATKMNTKNKQTAKVLILLLMDYVLEDVTENVYDRNNELS